MPHNRIWLIGYQPKWLTGPVKLLRVNVPYGSKYAKSHNNQLQACKHPYISDPFLLFNDDFFVMKPVEHFEDYHRGPLVDSIKRLKSTVGGSAYVNGMELTLQILKELGVEDPLDYGLHIPLTVHKQRWIKAWQLQLRYNKDKKAVHMRTIYGNLNNIAQKQMDDIKISNRKSLPTTDEFFLSTNDDSFNAGAVGDYIRSSFKEHCKYESAVEKPFVLK